MARFRPFADRTGTSRPTVRSTRGQALRSCLFPCICCSYCVTLHWCIIEIIIECPPTNGRARGGGAHNAHIIARNSACNTPMSSPILIDLTITPPASPPA
eukprot:2838283-Pyramimonas_sp.AAC.1